MNRVQHSHEMLLWLPSGPHGELMQGHQTLYDHTNSGRFKIFILKKYLNEIVEIGSLDEHYLK